MERPLGIIEVIGMVSAIACVDAMVKTAFVDVYNIERTGSGMITIMIEGDLASVQAALEVGADVAQSKGELVAVRAIARPYDGLEKLIPRENKGGDT
ncbi:BMC domain-containing protein [Evansella tamaricis]|uniref:BMC domain-containing protein n=1 Tax=Evansella tamaricis TaxID=2069301 RepID=A0ABS6JKK7_9BACI|nr:BMC domain-containing protein [Evansella tamaricis]MBU9714220.1 BMC domain-containing protein [Evansella tamaricis]